MPEETPRQDRLRFHDKCGSLVKLSNGNRTAERGRPLDEFNNAVVMTHRALRDSELFEIRIDRLVDKWSGSIEVCLRSSPLYFIIAFILYDKLYGTLFNKPLLIHIPIF